MAIAISNKIIDDKKSFSLTVYKPPLKRITDSIYEAAGVEFVIDYIGTKIQLIRIERSHKHVTITNAELDDDKRRLSVKAVFNSSKIIRKGS